MNFWQELRRRRVYRTAGLYIIGAWVVFQVADIFFPAWGVPETAIRYLIVAAAACFPIALVFGWRYDITSSGILRTGAATAGETVDFGLKPADYLILAVLLTVGLLVVVGSADRIREQIGETPAPAAERRANSIAVLPFTNLDTNPDTRFFSDGITEELLHRLSTLGALHVLASTSSFAFRNSEDGPAGISQKLGVRYLLQGSVRRDHGHVRIMARLIDETGFQVWSETFDRELRNIFAIQSEIASMVSSQVLNEIVPLDELPAGRTTENIEAYNEYLVGKAYFNARTPGWHEHAEAAFRRAIELDGRFAPPHAGLAMSLYVMRNAPQLIDEALEAAVRSLELDPELAAGHAIKGLIVFESHNDAAAGTRSLRRAIELDPSLAIAYNWLALALYAQGLTAEGDAVQDNGLETDPLNPPLSVNVANRESRNGNFERAERLVLRLTHLPEPPGMAYWVLTGIYTDWGRHDQALHWIKELARKNLRIKEPAVFGQLAFTYERLGMSDDAAFWFDIFLGQVPDEPDNFMMQSYFFRIRGGYGELGLLLERLGRKPGFDYSNLPPFLRALYGVSHLFAGNHALGIQVIESLDDASLSGLNKYMGLSDAIDLLHALAYAYQQDGQANKSRSLLLELSELVERVPPGSKGFPPKLEHKALNRVLSGDEQGALQALREAIDLGWANYYWLVNDPAWSETIRKPEFEALLRNAKAGIDRQRANVEAADAEQDFRAEIEQSLADQSAAAQ